MNKKITELTQAALPNGSDIGVLVRSDADYQFTFASLLQYIGNNLPGGAFVNFGSILPQNTAGKNGDIFINIVDNSFAQKVNGAWVTKYQYPLDNNNANFIFNAGTLPNTSGNDNDTYVNTLSGVFYKKTGGIWKQVFSMATGPAGPPGIKGDQGSKGDNGNSVLNGTKNPSNLNDGKDGDFYINTSTITLFGPKANGAWPAGYGLIKGEPYEISSNDPRLSVPSEGVLRLEWDDDLVDQFGGGIRQIMYLSADASSGPYKWNTSIQPKYNLTFSGRVTSIDLEGVHDTFFKLFINGIDVISATFNSGGGGSGGVSSFGELQGNPADNVALAALFDNIALNVSNEGTARQNANTTLQGHIDQANSDRITGDAKNAADIVAEITGRGIADTTLQQNITAEAKARADADELEVTNRNTAIGSAVSQLIDGAGSDANTFNKLLTKIQALQSIMGSNDVNLDSIQELVNAIKADEANITALTSGKVNIADIYNGLDYTLAGKVLDARQGKALSDAISALSTSLTTALGNMVDKVAGKDLSSNDFTNALLSKLNGVAAGATANSTDAQLRDRSTHTGTQTADTITDGNTNKAYTATEKTKLTGIAAGATLNDSDTNLKNRATHTGTQLAATISDFSNAVLLCLLTGISFTDASAIAATDNFKQALGKLQAQITANTTNISGKASKTYVDTNFLSLAAVSSTGALAGETNLLTVTFNQDGSLTFGAGVRQLDCDASPTVAAYLAPTGNWGNVSGKNGNYVKISGVDNRTSAYGETGQDYVIDSDFFRCIQHSNGTGATDGWAIWVRIISLNCLTIGLASDDAIIAQLEAESGWDVNGRKTLTIRSKKGISHYSTNTGYRYECYDETANSWLWFRKAETIGYQDLELIPANVPNLLAHLRAYDWTQGFYVPVAADEAAYQGAELWDEPNNYWYKCNRNNKWARIKNV